MKEKIGLMLSELWNHYRVDSFHYESPEYLAARDLFDLAAAKWFVGNNTDLILYYRNSPLQDEYFRVSTLVKKLKGAPREKVRVGKVYRGCLNTSSQGF